MFEFLLQKIRTVLNVGHKSANLLCNTLQIGLLLLFRYFKSAPLDSGSEYIRKKNKNRFTPAMDDYIKYMLKQLSENDLFVEISRELEVLNMEDYTLLHVASWSRQENILVVAYLLNHGHDVDSTTLHGHTPLHFAVDARKRHTVRVLLNAGASVNAKDNVGRSALHFAVVTRWWGPPTPYLNNPCDMFIVKMLLDNPETDVNPVDSGGNTPLMWAVKEQNYQAVKMLLKKGANPNIPNGNEQTPLHRALSSRNPNHDIVSALLENGADIYCEDKLQQTPVSIFVRNIRMDEQLRFGKRVVWWIAFKYSIRDSLRQELERIPELYEYLETCCKEVKLMKTKIVYWNFTLHDFASNCFQEDIFTDDPVEFIYKPVVFILLSESHPQYLQFILERMTRENLHKVLENIVPYLKHGPLKPHMTHLALFYKIRFHYIEDMPKISWKKFAF